MLRRKTIATALAATLLVAQQFEVVSIKPSRSLEVSSETDTTPGRLSIANATGLSLIRRAFGVLDQQVLGAPGWAKTERFDVLAVTAGAGVLTDRQRQPFVRKVLEERFGLKWHMEKRTFPVLLLTKATSGSKVAQHQGPGEYSMRVEAAPDHLTLRSVRGTVARLVEILSRLTGRIVIDETGLRGEYDFTLTWAQEQNLESAGPSLFTALREQAGLNLVSTRRLVNAVMIDHIDRPSPN
jgi:uncharacterized protein (TIGR03435 family)